MTKVGYVRGQEVDQWCKLDQSCSVRNEVDLQQGCCQGYHLRPQNERLLRNTEFVSSCIEVVTYQFALFAVSKSKSILPSS